MKEFIFDTEKAFLEKLDGKVYAVCNRCGRIICDILEDDYIKLVNDGTLIDKTRMAHVDTFDRCDSDYILANTANESDETTFIEKYGVRIIIKEDSIL